MDDIRIRIDGLVKDYGNGRGVFGVTIDIRKGEVYGYLGPNGAGKSTTMRHLMGFNRADSGNVSISGFDCWTQQEDIKRIVGYLPGEISLPSDMTGLSYLRLIADMRRMTSFSYAEELLKRFKIDPDTPIKRMSKGMKQKIAIISAFMHDPEIILLDEPSSGLDPLMQEVLVDLIKEEKEKGKTVLLSSHIFDEVYKVCDRVGILKEGRLIKETEMSELKHYSTKTFRIGFSDSESFSTFTQRFDCKTDPDRLEVTVTFDDDSTDEVIAALSQCKVRFISEKKFTLEDYFMRYYGGDTVDD